MYFVKMQTKGALFILILRFVALHVCLQKNIIFKWR